MNENIRIFGLLESRKMDEQTDQLTQMGKIQRPVLFKVLRGQLNSLVWHDRRDYVALLEERLIA